MNTISSSIAVISNIIIVTVVPITIGIISSNDDGALLALAPGVLLALAVEPACLADVVDPKAIKSLIISLLEDNKEVMLLVLYANDRVTKEECG